MHPAGFVGRGLSRLPGAGDRSYHGSRRDSKAAAASSLHSVQSFVYLSLPAAGGWGRWHGGRLCSAGPRASSGPRQLCLADSGSSLQ